MANVQVGFGAVVSDEDFPVLERIHCARIHVEIGIELLHCDREAACPQQVTEAGSRQTLAERGSDSAGDEDMFGRLGLTTEPGI